MDLSDPTTAALLAVEAFERASMQYALYGGLLLAAYGEPRETRDVDLAVADVTADRARAALDHLGVASKVEFDEVAFGGLTVARLALLGGEEDLGLNTLDIVTPRSARYRSAALDRAVEAPLRDRTVFVLTPEDFILFKLLSTRDRDLRDAASVCRRSGSLLDDELLEREVGLLADEVTDCEIKTRRARLQDLLA